MAQRGRDPRLNRRRQEDYYFEHEVATDRGRCFRGRPSRASAMGHPGRGTAMGHPGRASAMGHPGRASAIGHPGPTAAHRFSEVEVTDGNYRAGRKPEKYDYGHRRDRSRSPFTITDAHSDYSKKQQCETDTLLQNESIQITVGNDKFRSPFSSGLQSQEDTFSQTPITGVSRASTHDRRDYAEETPSVTRAREMALRTREMLSKLTGWTPLSLQPLSNDHVNTTERPSFINVSNSAYTKVSASSEMAQSILRNISAVAAAFCPKESGGVTHIKYKKLGKMRKSATEGDGDQFLYGEKLIPEKIEDAFSGLSGADESRLKCLKSASGDQSLDLAEPSNRKPIDSECDPVVANVLKSIGFNFELSKIMQEKAKKEREENEKNRVLIQQASSFLAKQLAGQSCNAQEVSTDGSQAMATRHIGDDLNETLRRKDADILYDDFSNSEDEFSGTEKKKWTTSSAKSELSLGKGWQNLQVAHSSPSGVSFPPGVPSPVSLLTTPPPRHPLIATVQPPPPSVVHPLQSSSLLLPPRPLLEANSQPVPHLPPSWPAYQVPLTTGSLPKWKSKVSQVTDEVEWEQNTQEFLRKLQEPRTTELPPNRETMMSRSPSSGSTSNERVKKQQQKKRSASKELWSRSHEQSTKRQRSEKVTITEHRKSCDQDTKGKRLSYLKEKLNCIKKEHSQLVSVRQKSTHTKEKLKINRRQQDELHAHIRALLQDIDCRSTEGYSGFVSNDEHSFGRTQRRESKVMTTQKRYHRRNPKEQNRERDQKKSSFMHRELSVDKKELSSKVITDKKAKLTDCSQQEEQMLSTGCPIENKLVNVEVMAEESVAITKESESKKEIAAKKRGNDHAETVGDEPKEETNNRADEKSLEDKRDVRSKDELQRSKIRYDYYDGGDNWCSICSSLFPKLSEFLDHLHCTAHQQVVASKQTSLADKPWKLLQVLQSKPHNNLPPISEPASGMEFLLPVKGFFCTLCQKFSGDCDDAELHALSEEHNAKFKQHCSDNPTYQKGYRSAKMEKMAVKKVDKEKTLKEGRIEKNSMSSITDSENDRPVTRQITHVGKKLRKPSSETTTVNSAKPLKDVLTHKFLPLKTNLEQNPNAVNGNLLNQANESFANLTKEAALLFSSNTMCNPVVSKESDQAYISETKIQTLLSSEISDVEKFDVNVNASSEREPTLKASLQGEADVRFEESLNAEKDTVKDIDNRNPTLKPADAEATEQTDLQIHLVQAPISMDSFEANESLRNLKIQRTVCMLDPVVPCDITNHFSNLNAECSTFVKVTLMPKTLPDAFSEVQSAMLQSGSNTRNTNAYEPATGDEVAQSYSTYLSQIEVDEREDPVICQSQMTSSTDAEEREDAAICRSQKPLSTEAEEMEDLAICQSQKPLSIRAEEMEDLAICQSQKPLSIRAEEMGDLAICQSQMPSSTKAEESENLGICQSQKPLSIGAEEMEDLAICQSQKPLSIEAEAMEDLAICQSQKPSSTDTEEMEDLAACQSQKPSSIGAEEMEDLAICQSQKPSSIGSKEMEDPAICQSQMPSSTKAEERENPGTCQLQKSLSIEAEEMEDPAICQTQKPSSIRAEEREDPAICQSQKPLSTEAEGREDPAICQTQMPSSTKSEERENPAKGQSQRPSCTEAEEREDLAICQSQKPSSTDAEEMEDPVICRSQKPSPTDAEEREDRTICQSQKPLSTAAEERETL